jgi:hypothetical protein
MTHRPHTSPQLTDLGGPPPFAVDPTLAPLEAWANFVMSIRKQYGDGPVWLSEEYGRFDAFAASLSQDALPSLLIHAYQRFRVLDSSKDEEFAESACSSILISTILRRAPAVSEAQALTILTVAHHYCGHGSDVNPPLDLALGFFKDRPYSFKLFDAASCYRDCLRKVRAIAALNTRRRLIWILWHDPRKIERTCHTRHIQIALREMSEPKRTNWEMLFRHSSLSLGAKSGKQWLQKSRELLERIGIDEFIERLNNWFTFPEEAITVGNAGCAMMRTLIWCGLAANDERALPILRRLKKASWKKSSAGARRKLYLALDWVEARPPQGVRGSCPT